MTPKDFPQSAEGPGDGLAPPRAPITTTTPRFPRPAGAVDAEEFEVRHDGRCLRFFTGTRRGTDDMSVKIVGHEEYNGPVVGRAIYVDAHRLDNELDAATVRELARMLIAAADELDALSDPDGRIGA